MGRKDKEWIKDGSKWQFKVDICIIAYSTKWLLTKHLREVHDLMVENPKLGRPSMSKGSP